jgi:hypothetical protein
MLGNTLDEDEGKGRQVRTSQPEVRVHGNKLQAEKLPVCVLGNKIDEDDGKGWPVRTSRSKQECMVTKCRLRNSC